MERIRAYVENNRQRFLEELLEFLRIPSVSADPAHRRDVRRAAEFVRQRLEAAGVDRARLVDTPGHPVVLGEKLSDPSLPTVLVYGHYDVQPADPLELWRTPPFEPVLRDGCIHGRGASDDKGQLYVHIKAIEYLRNAGFPCNLRFLLEGEEESGSLSLPAVLDGHRADLAADVALVSDTAMLPDNMPAITVGLRGLAAVEVIVRGASRDLHSGIFGGAVANPVHVLCRLIADLHDEHHRIAVPGIYDRVLAVGPEERALMAGAGLDADWYRREVGVPAVVCEEGFSPFECTTIRPSLDVNGIRGGYAGEGLKTVLPAEACAKISVRLVPEQRSEVVSGQLEEWLRNRAPAGVEVEVRRLHGGEPVHVPLDFPGYLAAKRAMTEVFGREPLPVRGGGSIPVVALLQERLGLRTVLMGFGQDSDAIHSPNERFGIDNYLRGIMASIRFLQLLPTVMA